MRSKRRRSNDSAAKDAELLARLVTFAEGQLPRADERSLLSALLHAGPAVPYGDTITRKARGWPVRTRESFRYALMQFLRAVVATREGGIFPEDVAIRSVVRMSAVGPAGHVVLTIDALPRDVLWWQTFALLQRVGVERISACQAPMPHESGPCGRLFVKFRRRTYCSVRCQNLVNVRIYRDPKNVTLRARAAARAAAKGK